jgi:RHS repeat-associated protein
LQYTGQQTDTTGLVYLHARYYDPSTTQFLTVDPLYTISGSRYGYVDANPLNDADPTGLCGWICKASIAAAAVVGTVALCLTVAGCPEAVAGDGLLAVVLVDGATEEAGGAVVTSSTAGRVIGAAAGGTITGLSGAMAMADSSGQKSAASDDSSEASNSGCGSGKTGNDTEPPAFRSDTSHIFRADRGHLSEDNPENRALIESAIKPENALAPKYLRGGGVLYRYAEELPDGNEVWAEVRNGEITNGGLNVKP